MKRILGHKNFGFVEAEDTFNTSQSPGAGGAHSARKSESVSQRPAFQYSGNETRRKGVSGSGFIDGLHGVGSRLDDFVAPLSLLGADSLGIIELTAAVEDAIGVVVPPDLAHESVTIRELAERVRTLTGSTSVIQYVPYDQAYEAGFEDMPRRVPDISKIKALLGYQPRLELDDIIRSVIEYTRGNGR